MRSPSLRKPAPFPRAFQIEVSEHLLVAHGKRIAVKPGELEELVIQTSFPERRKPRVFVQIESATLTSDVGRGFARENGDRDVGAQKKAREGAASGSGADDGDSEWAVKRGHGKWLI